MGSGCRAKAYIKMRILMTHIWSIPIMVIVHWLISAVYSKLFLLV